MSEISRQKSSPRVEQAASLPLPTQRAWPLVAHTAHMASRCPHSAHGHTCSGFEGAAGCLACDGAAAGWQGLPSARNTP
eukprot:366256-Chlamydomonas_euryale.AAC.19